MFIFDFVYLGNLILIISGEIKPNLFTQVMHFSRNLLFTAQLQINVQVKMLSTSYNDLFEYNVFLNSINPSINYT